MNIPTQGKSGPFDRLRTGFEWATRRKTQGPSTSLGMTVGLRLANAGSHLSKSAKGGAPGCEGRVCAELPHSSQKRA
jgi:hypothetical protein